jgi:hypothetical protein
LDGFVRVCGANEIVGAITGCATTAGPIEGRASCVVHETASAKLNSASTARTWKRQLLIVNCLDRPCLQGMELA